MPINPQQIFNQIRGQYDHTTATIKLGNTPITDLISEIGDAGGNTIENSELQYALGTAIAFGMNPGTIKPKTVTLNGWAETLPAVQGIIEGLTGGRFFGAEISLSITFGLKASMIGLSAVSAPTYVFAWKRARVMEDSLAIPKGISTTSLILQPITPWTINGKPVFK